MHVKSTATAIVFLIPMLLGGATKTDWEDWSRHGFNHPYHENRIIVRLEAGETINDICDCGFFSVNTRNWMLNRKLISEEQARRFCPEGLELLSGKSVGSRMEGA